jgi:3,4-dihydroxy-2-butanone 4-phosphate synthase
MYIENENNMKYCSIEEAIIELRNNKPIILVDNEDRENEGDLIYPAEIITTEIMAFIIKYTSGLICCAMSNEIVENLKLPLMINDYENTDPHKTAFTVSVDYKINTTTGISAHDRALTCKKLTQESNLNNFNLPGHIFPLKANKNGLKERQGHTEASIEICKLAGFKPCAVISEITSSDKLSMANKNELFNFALEQNLKILKIVNLIK